MKSISIITLLFCLVALSPAQGRPKALLVDETKNVLCSDEMKAYVDHFIIELVNDPTSMGYIIGSADKNIEGRFSQHEAAIKRAITFRRYPMDRIKFVRTSDGDEMRFQYWLVPAGAEPPHIETYREYPVSKTILFDKSSVNSYSRRHVDFGGGDDEPCDYGLNIRGYLRRLKNDPSLRAYLVAFSDDGTTRNAALTWLALTKRRIASEGLTAARLSTYYGGQADFRQMHLWLVPGKNSFSIKLARETLNKK